MSGVIRPPISLLLAGLAVLVGMAGLVRGAIPQASSSPATPAGSSIVVGGAYVRASANGVNTAGYFTIYNTSGTADVLTAISSGAGGDIGLETYDTSGQMTGMAAGLTIPAHGSVTLTPGKVHVMIQQLYGPLNVGQTVNFQLTFQNAGDVLVTAPVIGLLAPAPTAAAPK
ncbi:MAG: signal peptide protein [Frankiales bacterium]|nr:signal peptide protein [Frankiales bacterium]